jgi:hypothetical protein
LDIGWLVFMVMLGLNSFFITFYVGPLFARGDHARFAGTIVGSFFIYLIGIQGIAASQAHAALGALGLSVLLGICGALYGMMERRGRKRVSDGRQD